MNETLLRAIPSGLLLAGILLLGHGESAGQLYRFGKNKVQFAEFEWQKMETPNFEVYFFAEEEELAGYAAQMAEKAYSDLERKFGYPVKRRVPIVVYSSHVYFQQTNIIPNLLPEGVAGFTEFLKGRVALPLSGSLPHFERVLHHELVHVFTFDRLLRVLEHHDAAKEAPMPLWFSEGLAEYWSGEMDSYGEMIIRDALFSRRLVSIAQMHHIYGTFQMYKEGQSICAYMAASYGEDVFELMFENWWRADTFAEIFQITTGATLAELDRDWQYSIRKRYLPDISAADPPSQFAEALTQVGFNIKPVLRPVDSTTSDSTETDGGVDVLFFRNNKGYTRIARKAVTPGTGAGKVEIVVEGERSPKFESLHPLDTKMAVSTDGRWLAFSAQHIGRDHLFIWDLEQGKERRQLTFEEVVAINSPSWSPDGQSLVFSGAGKGGMTDLYSVVVATGELRPLTADIYHDRDPDWSPDGASIAFASDRWVGGRSGRYNLFVYDLETAKVRPLTRGDHNDLQPDWSADGRRLAFTSDRDAMYDLYAVHLDRLSEGKIRTDRLTHSLTGVFDPVWMPDGEALLFSGFEKRRFQIYRLETADDTSAPVADADAVADEPAPGAADSSRYVDLPPDVAQLWKLEGMHSRSLIAKRAYKRRMSLDIAQSQIAQDAEFGTSGGIQVGLSDLLGNNQYYFVLSHISGSETGFFDGLNLALTRLHLGRQLNVAWGLFRLNDRFTGRFGRFVREKRTGAFLEFSYPFSMFKRLETRFSMRRSEIDREFEGQNLRGWLMANSVSYTHDASLWIPTGPLEGTRYSLGMSQTVDFKSSRRFNFTLFGDYRHYHRLSRRSSWAVRLMGRRSKGDVPEFFSLGGSWTLRGYPWRSIWGSKLVMLNNELRFPLLDRLIVGLPFGNIDLSSFRGALFVDAGNAWNDEFDEWKGSIGMGTRMALGGVFVFRLDASRRTPDFKSIENNTNWEFFFGWDF